MIRKSKGRQKVEMVKMNNESNLQVTFSKRRSGLFKKASELCILCGTEVAIIVFSPGKKVFSFGHPGVEMVVDRFLSRNPPETSTTMQFIEAHRNATVRELNSQLIELLGELDMEKKRGEDLYQIAKANVTHSWWETPIQELNLPQLEQLKVSLENLKKNVARQADKVMLQNSNHHLQFLPSSSSGVPLPFNPNNPGFNPNMIAPPRGGHINIAYGRGFY